MCLAQVDKCYRKPRMEEVTVYKIMKKGVKTKYRTPYRLEHIPMHRWVSSKEAYSEANWAKTIKADDNNRYPSGFHVYTDKFEAEKILLRYRDINGYDDFTLVTAKARGCVATGLETAYAPLYRDISVSVFREIKLLKVQE